uniref:MULE transposase domain-containing protein n=1 Tax=Amphimedon queenslandica TaxID=400682 RepID=A0A1X7SXK8_AMPQE
MLVQEVTCAPEPMAVLCTDQQLNDIVRFCVDPFNFCVFGIDPTFNLGDFSVTPLVYSHLLLQDRKTKHSPILFGPMLVHFHMLFSTYNYFLSTLIGLKPELAGIKAVGSDGEKALVDAILRNFPAAVHLRCFHHLQQNIEKHLHEHNYPASATKVYISDIFGWTTDGVYHEGLVDCSDALEFNVKLAGLKSKWDGLENECLSNESSGHKGFNNWFRRVKAPEIWESTLRFVRESAGLGSPPTAFYTNHSESINAFRKESLHYKKNQWGREMRKLRLWWYSSSRKWRSL